MLPLIVAVPVVESAARPTRTPTPFWQLSSGLLRIAVIALPWIDACGAVADEDAGEQAAAVDWSGPALDRDAAEVDDDAGAADRDNVLASGQRRRSLDRRSPRAGADDRTLLSTVRACSLNVPGAYVDPITGGGGGDRRLDRGVRSRPSSRPAAPQRSVRACARPASTRPIGKIDEQQAPATANVRFRPLAHRPSRGLDFPNDYPLPRL